MEEPSLEQQYDDQSATDSALAITMDGRKHHSEQADTLQGYQSGMAFFYSTLSKSIVKENLDLSLMFLTPTDDKLNIKQKTSVQTMFRI